MIDERQYIKNNLHDFFIELLEAQGVANIPLIFDDENGTRPLAPFLMLSFRSTVSPGMPNYSRVKLTDGAEAQHITQHTRRNMTMYGFGKKTIDILETIKGQLGADIWFDKLRKRNLVIPQMMETLESPQIFETMRESGASFDFDLTYLRVIETEPGYIEEADISWKS